MSYKGKKTDLTYSFGGTELEREINKFVNMWRDGVDMNMKTSWNKAGGAPNNVRKIQIFDDYVKEVGENLVSNRKIKAVTYAVWMVNTKIYEQGERVLVYCRSAFFKQEIEKLIAPALYGYFVKPIDVLIDKSLEPEPL